MDAVRTVADEWGLPVHLDGARIFNAAVALGVEARAIAARADSVMFCLSKGLCAPVGSLLAGTRDFVSKARLKRKVMGGGMRQAGILAAAGIVALKDQTRCLADDHVRAKRLAQELAAIPGIVITPAEIEINMVFFQFQIASDAEQITAAFKERGILINPPENGEFRFVTHYWIGDAEIKAILQATREVLA
jgi:threonine aldolase